MFMDEERRARLREIGIVALVSAGHFWSHFFALAIPLAVPLIRQDLDTNNVSLGIVMAAAGGELRDASELRVKESDRIAAMVAGLGAIGASVEELPDGWRVTPRSPRDARITTHGDHRIAIAFAVAALTGVAGAVDLDDPACVAVSYPTFWADLAAVAS